MREHFVESPAPAPYEESMFLHEKRYLTQSLIGNYQHTYVRWTYSMRLGIRLLDQEEGKEGVGVRATRAFEGVGQLRSAASNQLGRRSGDAAQDGRRRRSALGRLAAERARVRGIAAPLRASLAKLVATASLPQPRTLQLLQADGAVVLDVAFEGLAARRPRQQS
eukprot:6171885-Pleurochrysis_carterae.AAC.1